MIMMTFVSFDCNTTGVTCGSGTDNPSGKPKFSPGFWLCSCYSILSFLCNVLYIVVCSYVFFRLFIVTPLVFSIFSYDPIENIFKMCCS